MNENLKPCHNQTFISNTLCNCHSFFSRLSSRVLTHKAAFLCGSYKGVKKKAVFHWLILGLCPRTALGFLARIN